MFLLKQISPAALLAMMVAAGICGFALFLGRERARAALSPLAVGIAYFAGHCFIAGWAKFPPADTTNWLPYFAMAAAVLGALYPFFPEGRASVRPGPEESPPSKISYLRVVPFALVAAGALRLLLRPKFQYGWSLSQAWVWVAGLLIATMLLAMILDALVRRSETTVQLPVFLAVVCAGTFGALVLSGSMLLGQFAAVLAGAILGSLVFAARKVALGPGIVPVFSLLLAALLISGYFFADLPATSAVLLAIAPIFALCPIGRPSKLLGLGIRTALVSIPVIIALIMAFHASPPLDI
jgi:hypothetical protein